MKRLLFAVLMLTGVFSAFSVNPQWEKFRNLKYRYPSANFDPGQFPSITGRFNGKTTDTLTLFPYDGDWLDGEFYYDQWILISKNGTVPSKIINSYYPGLTFEGDLDGNGRDEFGLYLTGMNGAWMTYAVYTVYNNGVKDFLSVQWWDGNEEDPRGIVMKGAKKGQVKYYTYPMDGSFKKRLKTATITKFLK